MEKVLICMAVHDTDENGRSAYTEQTLDSLLYSVDFNKHKLIISDNGSCDSTMFIYQAFSIKFGGLFSPDNLLIIENKKNLGTAEAVNLGIKQRKKGQHVIKMDNDVTIDWTEQGWVDEMVHALSLDPKIGILGLKRNDLEQYPDHPTDYFRSSLHMLPHEKGKPWVIVEETADIMGTCVMLNSALLDRIGYLKQPGLYGWDDVDCSIRSRLAGFRNCFLPHIIINHIDTGGNDYIQWKQKTAGDAGEDFQKQIAGYKNHTIPLFYSPFSNHINF